MQHIMIDLEMNKIEKQWRGKNKLSSELIEIGAVRMDDHFEVVDTYQSYVKPEFGTMDAVIIDLTGRESKLEAFLNLLSGYKILQVARTGITGLARGSFEH